MSSQKTLTTQFFVKPSKEKQFYPGLFFIIAIGILSGSIALVNINGALGYYLLKALQLIVFFGVGNMYSSSRQNFLKLHPAQKHGMNILFVAFLLCTLLSVFYLFLKKDVWLMAFSSSAAFILPGFLKLCWSLFISIPPKEFKTWVPHERKVSNRASGSVDNLFLKLKIMQHVSDLTEKNYTVFVPHHNRLGDFFSRFLAEQNSRGALIEDKDENGNKYAWEFFIIFFGFQLRRLDPGVTMDENKIKNNAVVYIKRLTQPDTLQFYKQNC